MNPENNNNIQKNNVNQNQVNKIETIDLNVKPTINDPQPKKGGNGILIVVFLIIGIFIFLLPFIDSYFKDFDIIGNGTTQTNEKNLNLYNGFIKIGEESFMTLSNIKFYNFTKKNNNTINFNYISSKKISDILNLNIFVELYNNAEDLIYRAKFNDFDKIEKSVVNSYDLNVTQDIYRNAKFAKTVLINEEVLEKAEETLLSCVLDTNESNVNLHHEVNYYFKLNGLIRYDVNKNILHSGEENEVLLSQKENLNNEYNLALEANAESVVKEDTLLSYTIDFNTFDFESEYTPLFPELTLESALKNTLISQDWVCN